MTSTNMFESMEAAFKKEFGQEVNFTEDNMSTGGGEKLKKVLDTDKEQQYHTQN